MSDPDPGYRIAKIELDEQSLAAGSADAEHERRVAIFDLLESNTFQPVDAPRGPYHVRLAIEDKRLVFDISDEAGGPVRKLMLSLSPLKRIIRDYFMICESYYDAIRNAAPAHIEAIDMGRRGVHNEGSDLLKERLEGKVAIDFDTARRLFTLVCALHRGPIA
ncbi:MAG: UPF0262 family protein [Maricaulaceae bacterium]